MNKQNSEIDVYIHESRVEAAKEISYHHLSKDELLKQYSLIVKGYEALVNEVKGLGDGDTSPDWEITGDLTLNLRSERSGKGDDRIYTITVECKDAVGNTTTGTVTVVVPKSQKK